MAQSRSDKPTTRKSRSVPTAENTRSAADVTDERYVWSGKVFAVFSIPNPESEPRYIRLDVSSLIHEDYNLYVESGPLFETEAPFEVFPPNFESRETPEEGNPVILSSRFELPNDPPGSMIQIAPRTQVNVTMQLRKDCHARQDFRVTVYRHYGRTRDSDFHKGRPLSREFFQIPEADTCALDVEVLTRTAHFRPWNLAARRGHYLWKLAFFGRPLFNRPELLVQAQNRGSLPVNARARLYKATGRERKPFGIEAPQETLAPGQECVWTFPLWLRDPEEADGVSFETSVEVKTGGQKLKDIDPGDKVNAEYHPYRSLPKDIVALFGILGLVGGGLFYLILGIPVPVTPRVGVQFLFDGQKPGDLPRDIQISDFEVAELDEDGNQTQIGSQVKPYQFQNTPATEQGNKKVYVCSLPAGLMFYHWPFGWSRFSTRERHFIMAIKPNSRFRSSDKFDYEETDLKFSGPLIPQHYPFINRNYSLRHDYVLVHDFAVRLKQNNYLRVEANLTGKAMEANKIDIALSVEVNGDTRPLTKSALVIKGKANPVSFDVTNYVTAGNPVNIQIIATTSNNYTSTLSQMNVFPKALLTTRAMENFQPSSGQISPQVDPAHPSVGPTLPPVSPTSPQIKSGDTVHNGDGKTNGSKQSGNGGKSAGTTKPTNLGKLPALTGIPIVNRGGPSGKSNTTSEPTVEHTAAPGLPVMPQPETAKSDDFVSSGSPIILQNDAIGERRGQCLIDPTGRTKSNLKIKTWQSGKVEVEAPKNFAPGLHTLQLTGNKHTHVPAFTRYFVPGDARSEYAETAPDDSGMEDASVAAYYSDGEKALQKYQNPSKLTASSAAFLYLSEAETAYRGILTARHKKTTAVLAHYKLAQMAFTVSKALSADPDNQTTSARNLAVARQEAWYAAKLDIETPSYTQLILDLLNQLYAPGAGEK